MARITRSMPCRLCGGPTFVQQTRGEPDAIRRFRWCMDNNCGHRFVTVEVFERDVLATPDRDKGANVRLARRHAPADA